VIAGLNGLDHPGLSTFSRIAAALVMVVTLTWWLPRWGIYGAALASITGYSVMFGGALFWFLRQQKITFRECMRPRWDDVPDVIKPPALRAQLRTFTGWPRQSDPEARDALAGSIDA
jgi:hypothetical protein